MEVGAKTKKEKKPQVTLKPCFCEDTEFEIGVDEAGRGPLFGRVYVAGVILPKDVNLFHHDWMKDSKQIKSRKKMVELADYIKSKALAWHIYYAEADEIDSIGILNCVMKGMHQCITANLNNFAPTNIRNGLLLVDGNYFRPYSRFDEETESLITLSHETVEKGDGTYSSIAAASILAKTSVILIWRHCVQNIRN